MQISVSQLTTDQFMTSLTALKVVLKKAYEYSTSKNFDFSVFMQTRLAPDQFPLVRQVQIATDVAKGCVARLGHLENPKFEDTEATYEQLMARIDKTIAFLKTVKPESFVGYEDRTIEFPWMPGQYLTGTDFLTQHAIPNFYFHFTTIYSILRANGVPLGKSDFLGQQNWHKR
ncbi:MAG: DUF1993 domain-containing protein [Proteobacteria bacterium]|jgi:hypothetical protein|nr:DUF1993 domain-containing protein [Pseudomonadota bacterium]